MLEERVQSTAFKMLIKTAGLIAVCFLLVHGCYDVACPSDWRGDTICDLACMTLDCGLDSTTEQMNSSDCLATCTAAGCTAALLGNSVCDLACNLQTCGWDAGDCGVCAQGCLASMLGNGVCDTPCNTESCEWDKGKCVFTK